MSESTDITKRLDVIIQLLLEQQTKEGMKREDQLLLMDSAGLSSSEIGRIIKQEAKNVSSYINQIKKRKNQKN